MRVTVVTRWSKITLVAAVSLYAAVVTFTNVTAPGPNLEFVSHVLSMDTTLPGDETLWRSMTAPAVRVGVYVVIVSTECLVALLCGAGAVRLVRARHAAAPFHRDKRLAICGLTLGILLFFTGFLTIGSEWFLMWQSARWNGQQTAFHVATLLTVILVYVVRRDRPDDA